MDDETIALMDEYLEKLGDHVPIHAIRVADSKKIIRKAIDDGKLIEELDEDVLS